MNSIPLFITAAFCIPAGIVIGFGIAAIFTQRKIRRVSHATWMEAIRHYQNQAAEGRR